MRRLSRDRETKKWAVERLRRVVDETPLTGDEVVDAAALDEAVRRELRPREIPASWLPRPLDLPFDVPDELAFAFRPCSLASESHRGRWPHASGSCTLRAPRSDAWRRHT